VSVPEETEIEVTLKAETWAFGAIQGEQIPSVGLDEIE